MHINTDLYTIVHDAMELLSDEQRWVKGALALDHKQDSCKPESDLACQWCEYGAVLAITRPRGFNDDFADYMNDVINAANDGEQYQQYRDRIKYGDPSSSKQVTFGYNDAAARTHAEMLARFQNTLDMIAGQPELFDRIPKYTTRITVTDD